MMDESGVHRMSATRYTHERPISNCWATARRWSKVRELISLVGDTDATVLIRGESGTGKELVARALRAASPRRDKAVRQGQLRGAAGRAPRIGDVRLRARRVHRRAAGQAGQVRVRQPRHDLPRRDRRDAAVAPGQAAPRAAGRRVLAPGRQGDVRVDVRIVAATNRRLEDAVAERALPRGPVLPPERRVRSRCRRCAIAARRSRCSSGTF